jgi:hypothetical protein
MKRLTAALLLTLSLPATADHYDVIEFKLKDSCDFATYMKVVKDFNEWGKEYGYRTEIANKVQHNDLTTLLWLGRSANAAAFGKAWDAWRDALADANSAPAKLNARFAACSTNVSRRSYDVY